jgi:uncharacterized protein (DUF2236 family)
MKLANPNASAGVSAADRLRISGPDGVETLGAMVSRSVNRERLVLLGWGRAILMQFAHPLIAAGVAEHSGFQASRVARLQRLHGTVRAMLSLTFGDEAQVRATADRINRIHDRVQGTLREPAGAFPAGTPYSAHDPALLRWVHCTLLDSVLRAYVRFIGPISEADADRCCQEATGVAGLLGIPDALLPKTTGALTAYLDERLASPEIVVTDLARGLARDVLCPPFHLAYWPVNHVMRMSTIGLLPSTLRAQYGFSWTARDTRALDRWSAAIRRLRPMVPRRLREWSGES